jgi:hypothetical protein
MSKKPIKDLPRKRDDQATKDEMRHDELDQVNGGLITTGVTAIGGVASKPTTTVIDE